MPSCTVRYHVRLVPKLRDPHAQALDAVGIFSEERVPDEAGEPGTLVSRRLRTFSGPTAQLLRDMVTRGDAWQMDVHSRVGPLEWDA